MHLLLGERRVQRPLYPVTSHPDSTGLIPHVRILLVDDQEDVLETLGALLESRGAHVVTSVTPEGALAFLSTRYIDVIVSDIAMPRLNGYEFLRRARELQNSRSTPAIAISALAGEPFEARVTEAGFSALLGKPVDTDELVGLIQKLVGPAG